MVRAVTMKVDPKLRTGSTLMSPSSVNLRNPTALSTTSTAPDAKANPRSQAMLPIA